MSNKPKSQKNDEDLTKRKNLTEIAIDDFKSNNPDLDYQKLTVEYPSTLKEVDLSKKEMANIPIHPVVLSVICGTIFGDASMKIQKSYKNARLQFRHSTRQTEWFMWKVLCILKEFTSENSIIFQNPDGKQLNTALKEGEILGKWHYQSLVDPKLTSLHKHISPHNIKTIARSWLNHMNNYFLMTLWLDDGSLSKGRQGVISCNSTPEKDARILAEYLTTVWGIKCTAHVVTSKITPTNPTPMEITIDTFDDLEKLMRIIAPIIPVKTMLYKVCLYKSNDPAFLQRWISELKSLVRPEWHVELDKHYDYLDKTIGQQN